MHFSLSKISKYLFLSILIITIALPGFSQTKESGDKGEEIDLQKRLDMVRSILRANKPELQEKVPEKVPEKAQEQPVIDESQVKSDSDSEKSYVRTGSGLSFAGSDSDVIKEEDKKDEESGSMLEEVEMDKEFKEQYKSVFDSADSAASIEESILPVEIIYLDKHARPASMSSAAGEDIPLETIIPEYVPHKWYPKNDQFSNYQLTLPGAFLPKRRTTSFTYKFGIKQEKAFDRFLGDQIIHDSESVDHSLYYSYAFSDNLNFTAGITLSDCSFDLNRDAPSVKNFENYRNAVLQAAGQSQIAALIKSQPVTYTPSRDIEEVTLGFQARLYTWDAWKTSLGCGVISNREKVKTESLVLYQGLPGLPVSFEDVFIEYQSHEAYLVFSKIIAKNLIGHAGYTVEQVKTAILTDMSRDRQDYHYPFAGIDLVLNGKTRLKAGYKDGEPLAELFYQASEELDLAAFYKSDVKLVIDDANSFDNYNIKREIENFGVYMSHRF